MIRFFEKIGQETLYFLEQAGRLGLFLFACVFNVLRPPYKIFPIVRQVHVIGGQSAFVIFFTGAFTGMALGLQGYITLRDFGSEAALGAMVSMSLIRELGPVLTALMVIGRAGSAMCAEIGIMRNSEQIDALDCMAIDPIRYLMVPKFIAAILVLPLLTSIFDVIGIYGGYLIGSGLLDLSPGTYFQSIYTVVGWDDIQLGLVKSLVFGLVIVWISTAKGYFLHFERNGGFGAEGVSRTTTNAVVMASVSVLVWNYLIGAFMV